MAELRNSFVHEALFEQSFWLTVLRDHTFFIQSSFAPDHEAWIAEAKRFHQESLRLIAQFEQLRHSSDEEMRAFTAETLHFAARLIQFKQQILDHMLACKLTIHLPPSLLDHMIREAQEFMQTMHRLLNGTPLTGAALAIHEANLWLPDGSGHAALIRSNVDPQENDQFETAHEWKKQFDNLTISLQEIQTKLRSKIRWVPSLERLMDLTTAQFKLFISYLRHLEEMLTECQVLGDLKPLFMDHMAREATYFLQKVERAKE